MGWSTPPRPGAEAAARTRAMRSINYRGRLDHDGNPLEGPGTAVRSFYVGQGSPKNPDLNIEAVRDLKSQADDIAEFGGGYQRAGHPDGLEDPSVVWPRGYRWDPPGEHR